ncbi:NTP transferase domain-containing protein [Candidatus Woesearchaeota archaeon]|nr:NTP transferase domain-containing protein [Candidatus Woesearchaeota archaeon]
MANIIPMAGLGSRFSKEGYLLPKPLLPVSGKPMIIKVIESLPDSDKWIFIVRKEHIDEYKIDRLLKSKIPGAIVVPVEKTTEGQASTCMLAMSHLDPEEPMFIAACDNSFLYDKEKYTALVNDEQIDAILWTFTKNKLLEEKPESWGWVKLEEDNKTIKDMSVKVPVSDTPFNDHAVVATFYFRKAKEFKEAYDLMVKENYRINNEFYVDSMPLFYKKLSRKSVIFDVDIYVGWGKPCDLYDYQEKEYRYENSLDLPDKWKRFFEKEK